MKVFITAEVMPEYSHLYFGVWIDAMLEPEEIQREIDIMLEKYYMAGIGYEVKTYEGFGTYKLYKWASPTNISEKARFIAKYPEFGGDLLVFNKDVVRFADDMAENHYLGCYKSIEDFIEQCSFSGYKEYALIFKDYTNYMELEESLHKKKKLLIINTQPGCTHVFSTPN